MKSNVFENSISQKVNKAENDTEKQRPPLSQPPFLELARRDTKNLFHLIGEMTEANKGQHFLN